MADLEMNERERKLFVDTQAFVAKICPTLPESVRAGVVAKIYDQMRRTLIVVHAL